MTDFGDVRVVTEPSRAYLNERQLVDYRSRREDCIEWLLTYGKDPEKVDGYAQTTVKARAARIDYFYRWVWNEEARYVADPTHDHADSFLQQLAYEDRTNADRANHQKALQMLFKWRHHERGDDEYEPELTFYSDDSATQPRDYLTREASLEYGSIPGYDHLSPDERDRWRAHLAQRFDKPQRLVTVDVFGGHWFVWKHPSVRSLPVRQGRTRSRFAPPPSR